VGFPPAKSINGRLYFPGHDVSDWLAHLEWLEVRTDFITLPAARTKTREKHKIPLTATMRAMLDAIPREGRYVLNGGERPMKVNGWHKDKLGVIAVYQRHDFAAEMKDVFERWSAHIEALTILNE
jgi:hypothetical protein